jgi:hypothetical protein
MICSSIIKNTNTNIILHRVTIFLSPDYEERKDFAAKYGEVSFYSRIKLFLENMDKVRIILVLTVKIGMHILTNVCIT